MSSVADRFVVILDANVLYPFRKRDILLSFSQAGLFRARWTIEIQDEWSRNLLAAKPELKTSIDSQVTAMRDNFPESLVEKYEALIPTLTLPDPNDRHVLAAAIKCGAQHIVTENLKDFPPNATGDYDVEPISADEFLTRTFDLYLIEATLVLAQIRRRYSNPSYTPSEFVMDLTAKGLPKLATRAREVRDFI